MGRFADQDGGRRRDAFHARGDVNRVADRIVVGAQVVLADRAHHHFAGMHADADLQRNALLQAHPVAMRAHRLLHPQGGKEGAQRMVLVGDRSAEQRQDAVAERLGT